MMPSLQPAQSNALRRNVMLHVATKVWRGMSTNNENTQTDIYEDNPEAKVRMKERKREREEGERVTLARGGQGRKRRG